MKYDRLEFNGTLYIYLAHIFDELRLLVKWKVLMKLYIEI